MGRSFPVKPFERGLRAGFSSSLLPQILDLDDASVSDVFPGLGDFLEKPGVVLESVVEPLVIINVYHFLGSLDIMRRGA